KPTQEGLYLHFKAIAEAVPEVDIMLYNIPIFVGVNRLQSTAVCLRYFALHCNGQVGRINRLPQRFQAA
ncbi:MAG: dihydrodipicolinate synthase family protein, partial [Neisseriaceae bacterium]|nr:dihydrodipicolinate synthase family protein [Neisseriaceae bacterium]